jgi:probable HAF family extracellular repeat protein
MMKLFVTLAASLAMAPAFAAPSWRYVVASATLTDLGAPGTYSIAYDINNRGSIVGSFLVVSSGNLRAFYFPSDGILQDATEAMDPLWSSAYGINASDTVVGVADTGNGMHAFRFTPAGGAFLLGDASPSGTPILSNAVAVADSGFIVGQRNHTLLSYREATIWSGHATFDALENTFPYDTYVADVNANGMAVGKSVVDWRARRWSFGTPTATLLIPPVSGGVGDITALGINSHGHVVGKDCCAPAGTPGVTSQAMFWNGISAMSVSLGVLPAGKNSDAEDINDGGFVVGSADRQVPPFPPFFPGGTDRLAYLYHPDFGMYVLPTPPVALGSAYCRAHALNERKSSGLLQVVGYCQDGT